MNTNFYGILYNKVVRSEGQRSCIVMAKDNSKQVYEGSLCKYGRIANSGVLMTLPEFADNRASPAFS